VTSQAQADELRRVLGYEKLCRYVKPDEARMLLETLDVKAQFVEHVSQVALSSDPDDNAILAAALKAAVHLIVSGDKPGMLKLGKAEGIPIVTPRQALDRLEAENDG
jgi:predicted nucleic acid-binding protein